MVRHSAEVLETFVIQTEKDAPPPAFFPRTNSFFLLPACRILSCGTFCTCSDICLKEKKRGGGSYYIYITVYAAQHCPHTAPRVLQLLVQRFCCSPNALLSSAAGRLLGMLGHAFSQVSYLKRRAEAVPTSGRLFLYSRMWSSHVC